MYFYQMAYQGKNIEHPKKFGQPGACIATPFLNENQGSHDHDFHQRRRYYLYRPGQFKEHCFIQSLLLTSLVDSRSASGRSRDWAYLVRWTVFLKPNLLSAGSCRSEATAYLSLEAK
jgi:hypothetical protein